MRIKSVLKRNESFAVRRETPAQISGFTPASLSEVEAARYLGMSRAWLKKSRDPQVLPDVGCTAICSGWCTPHSVPP